MNYRESSARLADYRRQIAEIRDKMRHAQAAAQPEEVPDYVFANADGAVRLSELFTDKPDLIVIHNMGASCRHCTLWADGFNGIYDHLANRAPFVVSSPDAPDTQASSRFPFRTRGRFLFSVAHFRSVARRRQRLGGTKPVLISRRFLR